MVGTWLVGSINCDKKEKRDATVASNAERERLSYHPLLHKSQKKGHFMHYFWGFFSRGVGGWHKTTKNQKMLKVQKHFLRHKCLKSFRLYFHAKMELELPMYYAVGRISYPDEIVAMGEMIWGQGTNGTSYTLQYVDSEIKKKKVTRRHHNLVQKGLIFYIFWRKMAKMCSLDWTSWALFYAHILRSNSTNNTIQYTIW